MYSLSVTTKMVFMLEQAFHDLLSGCVVSCMIAYVDL